MKYRDLDAVVEIKNYELARITGGDLYVLPGGSEPPGTAVSSSIGISAAGGYFAAGGPFATEAGFPNFGTFMVQAIVNGPSGNIGHDSSWGPHSGQAPQAPPTVLPHR